MNSILTYEYFDDVVVEMTVVSTLMHILEARRWSTCLVGQVLPHRSLSLWEVTWSEVDLLNALIIGTNDTVVRLTSSDFGIHSGGRCSSEGKVRGGWKFQFFEVDFETP